MESKIRVTLLLADNPEYGQSPPEFDWSAMRARVLALKPEIERIAGRGFVLDENIQDATFFADLSVRRHSAKPNWIDIVFAVRFSNFGELFTIWNNSEAEQLPECLTGELIAAVCGAGFRFVPASALDEIYLGPHSGFQGGTWRDRFFDYI